MTKNEKNLTNCANLFLSIFIKNGFIKPFFINYTKLTHNLFEFYCT